MDLFLKIRREQCLGRGELKTQDAKDSTKWVRSRVRSKHYIISIIIYIGVSIDDAPVIIHAS